MKHSKHIKVTGFPLKNCGNDKPFGTEFSGSKKNKEITKGIFTMKNSGFNRGNNG